MFDLKRILSVMMIFIATITLFGCDKDDEKYTVTFENTDFEDVEVVSGEKLVKPIDPTSVGYEFVNWYEDAAFTVVFDFEQEIKEDTTVYAKFNAVTQVVNHAIMFEGTTMANAEVVSGGSLARPSDPVKDNHNFDNWYADAAFTTLFDFDQAITEDTTVYAKFSLVVQVVNHTVVFDDTTMANAEVVDGALLTRPTDPSKDDYVFYNWYADAAFTTLFDFDQPINTDTTIYARYSISIAYAKTVAGALAHATQTTEKHYISGTIKSIGNIEYGNMVITDGVDDFNIYGVFSSDGTLKYEALSTRPVVGDTVLLYGVLSKYNENLEMKNSWLIDMQEEEIPEFDLTDYTAMTIADSRTSDVDTKMVIEGVVAKVTFANGMTPNGLFLVDTTGAIYVYDPDIAASVTAGDTIQVAGVRTNFILGTEASNAEKLGYQGAIQLAEATLVSKTSGDLDYSKDGIEEITVKELLDTDPTVKNITGNIYKVNAFINEVAGLGFTNFYINDLDGTTGSYAYSMNGGNDFSWLREFDGSLKTMYVAVINGKSTASELVYRFVPISIESDYSYDQAYNPTLAVKYFGLDQFISEYSTSPSLELLTSFSSATLGITDVALTYSSSDATVAYFEEVGGKMMFETGVPGTVTITITAVDGANTYSEDIEITVLEDITPDNIITIASAIASVDDTIVTVEGVVAASLVNKSGFYIIDETGVIAVELPATELAKVSLGQLVTITGNKTHYGTKTDETSGDVTSLGQIVIRDASVLVNKFGDHEYSKDSFLTGKVLEDFTDLDVMEDHSTNVYTITATVDLFESAYYSIYKLKVGDVSMNIYSSSASQLSFLQEFVGEEVVVEFTVVNWNGKKYSGSIISITLDGVTVVNNSNFRD